MNHQTIPKVQAASAPRGRGLLAAASLAAALLAGALAAPAALRADGLIVISDPPPGPAGHFRFAPLQVLRHQVSVEIRELAATTTVEQEFFNPNDAVLEGTYLFPLPSGAVIDRLAMEIDGKMSEAELLPAERARAIYEEIVRKSRDPALLEYVGRGAFRLRVFPIQPRAGKLVRLRYTQLLKSDSGLTEYVYPLNTEKFSSAPLERVSITVSLEGRLPLKSLYCPTHEVEIRRDGERRAVVGWEERRLWPDTDFKLVFSRQSEPLGISLLASRRAGQEGYFLLLASPGLSPGQVQPKDICFVVDTSGSMAGGKLEQARRALAFCLDNLNAGDRFEVIRFATEAEALFGELAPAGPAAVRRAQDFVAGLKPLGGTAIGDALAAALRLRGGGREAGGREEDGRSGRPYLVVFLTDGLPTVGETREEALVGGILRAGGGTRIFCFGIGTDVNTHLLDRVAEGSRALSRYVLPGEDLELALSSFYSKIRDPVLADLGLSFSNPKVRVSLLEPAALPDLFNGEVLAVFGRYSGSGAAEARITGSLGGKQVEFSAEVDFPAAAGEQDWIPRLWAARRVGRLLDEIRLRGESAELRDEVVALAREHGIVTPYTAYLVLEDEARRGVAPELRSFREMEQDREVSAAARGKLDSVRAEAKAPERRTGAEAVANAQSVLGLKNSRNAQALQEAEGLEKSGGAAGPVQGYKDWQARNYALAVKVVSGRAFFQNGTVWTDAAAQGRTALKRRRVRFAAEEYFELLRGNRELAAFLALGNNLDVVVDDTLIQIRDE
jgi:Ca-activated chloride channel family protein